MLFQNFNAFFQKKYEFNKSKSHLMLDFITNYSWTLTLPTAAIKCKNYIHYHLMKFLSFHYVPNLLILILIKIGKELSHQDPCFYKPLFHWHTDNSHQHCNANLYVLDLVKSMLNFFQTLQDCRLWVGPPPIRNKVFSQSSKYLD